MSQISQHEHTVINTILETSSNDGVDHRTPYTRDQFRGTTSPRSNIHASNYLTKQHQKILDTSSSEPSEIYMVKSVQDTNAFINQDILGYNTNIENSQSKFIIGYG